jgi:hypothetical protein
MCGPHDGDPEVQGADRHELQQLAWNRIKVLTPPPIAQPLGLLVSTAASQEAAGPAIHGVHLIPIKPSHLVWLPPLPVPI